MTRKLSLKQKEFIQEYLKTKNGTLAALKVYNAKNKAVARVIASQNLTKLNISQEIDKHLQAQGYHPRDSVRRLVLTAEAGAGIKATASDSNRADELLLKLSGHLVNKQQSVTANFNIDNMNYTQLLEYNSKLKKLLDRS
jgi:hypothetical protein